MSFQTEVEFVLPHGFVDKEGNLHKEGIMRLATAADEILPLKDPRVQTNPAYLTIILLSRVVTRLGSLTSIDPRTIENLFVSDMAYLQDLYQRINENGANVVKAVCPKCENKFDIEVSNPGE